MDDFIIIAGAEPVLLPVQTELFSLQSTTASGMRRKSKKPQRFLCRPTQHRRLCTPLLFSQRQIRLFCQWSDGRSFRRSQFRLASATGPSTNILYRQLSSCPLVIWTKTAMLLISVPTNQCERVTNIFGVDCHSCFQTV